MNEVLNIHTTHERFFYEYLVIKKPFLDMIVSKITGTDITIPLKPLKLFSLILYQNFKFSNLSEEEKWKEIFSKEHKKHYMEYLSISSSQLNTYITLLRSYKMLDGKQITRPFMIHPEKEFELIFKFSLNGEK